MTINLNDLTIQNLPLMTHDNGKKQFRVDFKNKSFFSIVGGMKGIYGNGVDTFELFTSEHDDTETWAEVDRINEVLQDMQEKHGEIKEINFGI